MNVKIRKRFSTWIQRRRKRKPTRTWRIIQPWTSWTVQLNLQTSPSTRTRIPEPIWRTKNWNSQYGQHLQQEQIAWTSRPRRENHGNHERLPVGDERGAEWVQCTEQGIETGGRRERSDDEVDHYLFLEVVKNGKSVVGKEEKVEIGIEVKINREEVRGTSACSSTMIM